MDLAPSGGVGRKPWASGPGGSMLMLSSFSPWMRLVSGPLGLR